MDIMKHSCNLCNYNTNILSNYKKHITSNKHNKLFANINDVNNPNDTNIVNDVTIVNDTNIVNDVTIVNDTNIVNDIKLYKCKYCDITYKNRSNRSRHVKKCEIEYNKIQDKIKLDEQIEQQNKLKYDQMLKIEIEKERRIQQKQFLDFITNLIKNTGTTNIINNINNNSNNSNNTCVNFNYIKKNFTDPLTLEECLEPPLSALEKYNVTKSTPIVGCELLIKSRCITDVDISKRPIHNIDSVRNKFAVYCGVEPNKGWVTKNGSYIVSKFIPFIMSLYNKKLHKAAGDECLLIAKELHDLQTIGKKKIGKSIGDATYIKNTIILDNPNNNQTDVFDKYTIIDNDTNDSDDCDNSDDSDNCDNSDSSDEVNKPMSNNVDILKSIMDMLTSMSNNNNDTDNK
jgi:uncharacterized C2H2 Zn-finger protein